MYFKNIKEDFDRYAPFIWKKETTNPRFQKSAWLSWLSSYEKFKDFSNRECSEIHGMFSGKNLLFCIYFETQTTADHLNVHLSVLDRFDIPEAVKHICALRDAQFRKGVRKIDGWALDRNFGLKRIMNAVGFVPTELEMRYGHSHGKSLKWRLHRITRI